MTTSGSNRIVVGVDGSKSAVKAALWAADEAESRDLPLRLIYVVDRHHHDRHHHDEGRAVEYGHRVLRAVADELSGTGQQVKVEVDLLHGDPVDVLAEASRSAEMVCVGWKGRHDSGSAGRGATAAGLAVAAHCSVAIVRRRRAHRGVGPHRWIVAVLGTHFSAQGILTRALDEALLRHAEILALTPWGAESAQTESLRAEFIAQLDDRDPAADITLCVLPRPDDITDLLAQSADIDQLVIASADDDELVEQLRGTGVRDTLRGTNCSVLLVHSDRKAQ
ncbi:universal stress protein [Mycobacterium sp. MBM]|nr:universal stress protein [Mycobacterium sp. MBM]